MDDIIARLRNKYQGQLPILLEAADEIERLQALLAEALKPKDIWHDCSHCQGHEPSDS